MTRLSALDALGRGLANVRGNLPLVLASTLGSLAVLGLVVLGLVPGLAAAGVGFDELESGRWIEEVDWMALLGSPRDLLARLGGLMLSLGLALTVASVVFAWYHGGVLGVLAAGDAQAPAGAGRPAYAFRTWSWRLFAGEAARLVGPVFWFYGLLLLLWSVLAIAAGLLVFAAVSTGIRSGPGAGLALGCGGTLPLLFAFFVVYAATLLGQADLPRPGSGAVAAAGAGLRVLGRRLGAALLLSAILFVAALAVGLGFALLDLGLEVAVGERPVAALAVQGASMTVQLLASSWLNLVFAAAFLALLRGERAIEAAAAG